MSSRQTDRNLRIFGFIFGTIAPVFIYLKWGRGNDQAVYAALALSLYCLSGAAAKPAILKPLQFLFSYLFNILQQAVTFAVLTACFYLMLAPLGILFRLFKNDVLDMKIDKSAGTYWKEREQKCFRKEEYYKNQF